MNITLTRNLNFLPADQSRQVINLARKLKSCATGHYPHGVPAAIFRAQAQALADMPQVMHSIMASPVEVSDVGH